MNAIKFLVLALMVAVIALVASESVTANPYTGYNTIGSYYQYQYGYAYSGHGDSYRAPGGVINLGNPYYNYQTMPRAGGWFGGGSGWITGLRQPYYGCVAPTHTSYLYRPSCGGGSFWGGSGYGYPGVDTNTYRPRMGGAWTY
jgi:hypothetical protein